MSVERVAVIQPRLARLRLGSDLRRLLRLEWSCCPNVRTGAQPVAKGWNNKRGKVEKGCADTHVTAHDGRPCAL